MEQHAGRNGSGLECAHCEVEVRSRQAQWSRVLKDKVREEAKVHLPGC